jgi:hypothetical protein
VKEKESTLLWRVTLEQSVLACRSYLGPYYWQDHPYEEVESSEPKCWARRSDFHVGSADPKPHRTVRFIVLLIKTVSDDHPRRVLLYHWKGTP